MYKKLILLLLLICQATVFAQVSSCVVNSETKKPIPYVNIRVEDEDVGTYTDEKGEFTLNNVIQEKNVVFSSVGYEKFALNADKITDTVFLNPKIIRLSEVIILKKKNERSVKIGGTEGERALIWDFSFYKNERINIIAKYFPADMVYDEMPFLKKVKIRTHSYVKDTFFNLRFYSKGENGELGGLLYDQDIIGEVKRGDRILVFDVSKLNIMLPSDGFFVGVLRMIPEEEKKVLEDGSIISGKTEGGPGLITVKDMGATDTWSIFKGVWKKWRGLSAAIELEVTN